MGMETSVVTKPVRVILADDHPLIREGLRTMLEGSAEVDVLDDVEDGKALIAAVEEHQPDVVLVDIRMPGMDGIEAVRRIRKHHPDVKALMLTVHDEDAYVREAITAGATGYLLKTVSTAELIKGIVTVAEGKAILHPAITRAMIEEFATVSTGGRQGRSGLNLSKREQEVLQLLAYGKSNKEIAKELGIGAQTVKTHVSHIFTKLGTSDRTGAVALALRKGLVE